MGKMVVIGRAKDCDVVLNDRRVSRRHAHMVASGGVFTLVDGFFENGELRRSVNHVYVNGAQITDKVLSDGDSIRIGETQLDFRIAASPAGQEQIQFSSASSVSGARPGIRPDFPIAFESVASNDAGQKAAIMPSPAKGKQQDKSSDQPTVIEAERNINYDDKPLGATQLEISANEIIGRQSHLSLESELITPSEIKDLRRKAKMLELLYEMSRSLGTTFDLKAIFDRATDLIFRGTPADRVVALLADETLDGKILDYSLVPLSVKIREEVSNQSTGPLTISRTITRKVMREKVALLSQDARSDEQFRNVESIVVQGVRSTICAPLITESNVHGVIYADRLDPFAAFTPDHLELIGAVAAQAALTVETVKAHKRLAREEVARANYSRFMPEYVVKQLLKNPDSFTLGGVNQVITVLFADIRGFTSLAEREDPSKIVSLLNRYFSEMSEIIFAHGGTLDKYIGDGLMALFGAPTASEEDALNAVKAAVSMQKKLRDLNKELRSEGLAEIAVGIGLHTGEALVGYIGSDKRSEYTAIGDTVNLAARLESNAAGGEILISDATAEACRNVIPVKVREPLTVKNRTQPVKVLEVRWA
jgi:adenylate cyclase